MFTWEEIHKVLGGELRGEGTDQQITSVVIDSRKVTPGALFVAMHGERVDSHQFIAECYEKGAVACLCEKTYAEAHEISVPEGKLLWIVPETVQAMGNLAAYYRKKLGIPVIGVTGSVGKTTAKDMIAAALSGGLKVFKTPGNLNNKYGLPLAIFQIEEDTQAADGDEPFRRDPLFVPYRKTERRCHHKYWRFSYRIFRESRGHLKGKDGNV